ncbi:MAG: 23S rRNA (uracil(1939)-C(5))-methyltransferase RlmD [Firmicutes bacterium]|nr:23S rRNA (uracil(1939)-C(5))-methyltransferase RlmD [Bacillota bacterium]
MKDIITIEIVDMTEEGAGIGHISRPSNETSSTEALEIKSKERGMTVFVSGGAAFGDVVSCEITKVKKNYALANLVKVIEHSKYRREDVCQYINDCGGCAFGMLDYNAQLELKVTQLKSKLVRIAGVENPVINPILPYESYLSEFENDIKDKLTLGYRNKAVMAVGEDDLGNPIVGFRASKSHKIIDCICCRIQQPTVMALADALRTFMREYGVRAYNPKTKEGLIKSLMVRTAYDTKEVMAAITISGKGIPNAEEFSYMLDDSIRALDGEYSLESIVIISERRRVEGNKAKNSGEMASAKSYVLAGKQRIKDRLMGLRFDISAESFYQVNSEQTVRLYEEVLRMLDAKEGEKIIDAYCGIGTIGLIAAARTKADFMGIESVPQAVIDANKNAIRNLIVNALFVEGRAEDVLTEFADRFAHPDAVIVDPPRAGCASGLIDAIIKAKPSRVIYVSCDQGTLARDIKLLIEGGYELKETTPCDMFPDTGGLESVSLLAPK